MKSWHGITSEPSTDVDGETLAIFQCSKSIGEDGFSIQVTVLFLWRDETRLQKPFRDTWRICPGGLKANPGYISELCNLLYLCLGEVGMITPSFRPHSMVLQISPFNAKNALSLTEHFSSL